MYPVTSQNSSIHNIEHKPRYPKLNHFFTASTIVLVLAASYSFSRSSLRFKATLLTSVFCSFMIRLWLERKYLLVQIPGVPKKKNPLQRNTNPEKVKQETSTQIDISKHQIERPKCNGGALDFIKRKEEISTAERVQQLQLIADGKETDSDEKAGHPQEKNPTASSLREVDSEQTNADPEALALAINSIAGGTYIVSIHLSTGDSKNSLYDIESDPSQHSYRIVKQSLKIIRAQNALNTLYRAILINGAHKCLRDAKFNCSFLENPKDQEEAIRFINEPDSKLKELLLKAMREFPFLKLISRMEEMPRVMAALGITYTTIKEIAREQFLRDDIKTLCKRISFKCSLNAEGGFKPNEWKEKALKEIAQDKLLPLAFDKSLVFLFSSGIVEPQDKIAGKTLYQLFDEEIKAYKSENNPLEIPQVLFEKGFVG